MQISAPIRPIRATPAWGAACRRSKMDKKGLARIHANSAILLTKCCFGRMPAIAGTI